MATETNLTKVHIFPSNNSFNNHKASLDSTELSFIPAPELVQFGYHETTHSFEYISAGGKRLLLQSGQYYRNGSTHTITFAVPFASGDSYIFLIKNDNESHGAYTAVSSERSGTFIKIHSTDQASPFVWEGGIPREVGEWFAIGRGLDVQI